ncbi:isoprenoid synthase domain-containing protein [Crepidotus variabilis]|uniref:Isoprenoid synthase domain-containing protein n=1 Tax=Crepidotus variabilis TaxID=179855 RepID=A0A9P6ENM1_9AGAR|nr:isoprenoid synthase domain-containing protein [Crepidotus variabilis]
MRLCARILTRQNRQSNLFRQAKPLSTPNRRTVSTSTSTVGLTDPHAYCRDLVRKHDYDSYLNSFFYPSETWNVFFAVKAFSVELATIQDSVSNAAIGRMRMQFWRDAVKGISDDRPPKHPVALALHETSKRHKIPAYHLKRIVDARDAELSNPGHMTVDSLTAHAESTSSTVLYILLSILSLSASSAYSHAASHLGAAQTFSTLLRALPYHAKQRHLVIPAEITSKHKTVQEEVFRYGPEANGIEDAVFDFATLAHDHLVTARSMLVNEEGTNGKIPKEAMPVFVAAVPVSNYLKRLEQSGFNAFDPKLQRRDGWLPLQMWRQNFRRTF